jgi:hypothetical protein
LEIARYGPKKWAKSVAFFRNKNEQRSGLSAKGVLSGEPSRAPKAAPFVWDIEIEFKAREMLSQICFVFGHSIIVRNKLSSASFISIFVLLAFSVLTPYGKAR